MSGSVSGMVKPTSAMTQGAPSRLYVFDELRENADLLQKVELVDDGESVHALRHQQHSIDAGWRRSAEHDDPCPKLVVVTRDADGARFARDVDLRLCRLIDFAQNFVPCSKAKLQHSQKLRFAL